MSQEQRLSPPLGTSGLQDSCSLLPVLHAFLLRRKRSAERSARRRVKMRAILSVTLPDIVGSAVRERTGNVHRDREQGLRYLYGLSDCQFQRAFRLDRTTFFQLLDRIKPALVADVDQAVCSSGSAIAVEVKLAIALRWLAGGSYIDIAGCFGIEASTLTVHVWRVLYAIDAALCIEFPFDEQSLQAMERGFFATSANRMPGCVAAGDGLVVRTRAPYTAEVGTDKKAYMNRKGYFALVVCAFCDARCRFVWVGADHSGGTHDSVAYKDSTLAVDIEKGKLPKQSYLIGDEAYQASLQFLTPWSGKRLSPERDAFNYHLSHQRQVIERAFGQLTKRWGIFWRPFLFGIDKWSMVIRVACKLHNLCVESNVPLPDMSAEETAQADNNTFTREATGQGRRVDVESCPMRDSLTERLAANGILRPSTSMHSRAV